MIAHTHSDLQALRDNLSNYGAAPLSLQNRFQIAVPIRSRRVPIIATVFCFAGCGSSIEDSIEGLGGAPDVQAAAKHELVLASKNAVEPLIQVLASDRETKIRAEVADILVSLTMRTADERIAAVLEKHLLNDPEPVVRGRIAEELGLRIRSEFLISFFGPFPIPLHWCRPQRCSLSAMLWAS